MLFLFNFRPVYVPTSPPAYLTMYVCEWNISLVTLYTDTTHTVFLLLFFLSSGVPFAWNIKGHAPRHIMKGLINDSLIFRPYSRSLFSYTYNRSTNGTTKYEVYGCRLPYFFISHTCKRYKISYGIGHTTTTTTMNVEIHNPCPYFCHLIPDGRRDRQAFIVLFCVFFCVK